MAATLGISAVFVAVPALYTTVKLVGAGSVLGLLAIKLATDRARPVPS